VKPIPIVVGLPAVASLLFLFNLFLPAWHGTAQHGMAQHSMA